MYIARAVIPIADMYARKGGKMASEDGKEERKGLIWFEYKGENENAPKLKKKTWL